MKKIVLNELKQYSNYIKGILITLGILEVICAVSIAILNRFTNNPLIFNILLVVGFFYAIFVFFRLYHLKFFSKEVIDNIDLENKNLKLSQENRRKEVLSSVHVDLMKNLNEQTCNLDSGNDTINLCDTGIKDNLSKLLEPVINNTYFLLSSRETDSFTHGLYLSSYSSLIMGERESGLCIIHDGLNLNDKLPKELMEKNELSGCMLEIQNSIRSCFNNKSFKIISLSECENNLEIVCSQMYEACHEDDNDSKLLGVYFIIKCCGNQLSHSDIETQMKIYNRVIANWMYSFNQCISGKKQEEINEKTRKIIK